MFFKNSTEILVCYQFTTLRAFEKCREIYACISQALSLSEDFVVNFSFSRTRILILLNKVDSMFFLLIVAAFADVNDRI